MYVAPAAKIVDRRRITGLGIGAAVLLGLALLAMLGLGLYVGVDYAAWSTSTQGQRMAAAVSLGLACGALFALLADVARHALR